MTKQEKTFKRDLTFSQWIRNKLPDSKTGFTVSDLDFVIWNWKTKNLMLLEVKTRNSNPAKWQAFMWRNIHKWIKKGIDMDWNYCGFHLIVFENTSFEDGVVYLDHKPIKENDLIKFLSFEDYNVKTS